MKVKLKEKEQTAMEKRNTAISVFVLAALLPLLLTLFLGYKLGQTRQVNEDNFIEKLTVLQNEKKAIKTSVEALNSTFLRADNYFEKFSEEEVRKLENKLDAAESELAFTRWDNDMGTAKDRFKHQIDTVGHKILHKDMLPEITSILDNGKKWLHAFAEVKEDELNAVKLVGKKELGVEVTSDLEKEIEDLKAQRNLKDMEIIQLKAALQQGQGAAAGTIADMGGDKNKAETDLMELRQKAAAAYDKIIEDLDFIRSEIVPNFEGQGFFKIRNNKDKIEALKTELENKLNAIERHSSNLK